MRAIPLTIRLVLMSLTAAALVFLFTPRAAAMRSVEGTVPQAASAMGRQIDRQIADRLMQVETPARDVSLAVTVPVDLNDLDESMPLARQMAEELSRWFVQAGYNVQEIRKGRMVLAEPGNGEKLLTRRRDHMSRKSVDSFAVLTGTYTVTSKSVRFNIRVLQTDSQDVLGMATISVPITSEIRSLLGGTGGGYAGGQIRVSRGIGPSVGTSLP